VSKRSAFRFVAVTTGKRSTYSVWRGEVYLGFVQLRTSRITTHGVTQTFRHGWDPTYVNSYSQRSELPAASTRETAARMLWDHKQKDHT